MKILSIMFVTVLCCPKMAFADNEQLREQFNKLDDNNNGMLTREELQANPELVRYSNFYAQGSFFLADINKDNQIDFSEFEAQEEVLPY